MKLVVKSFQTSATMLTVFYILLLAVVDFTVDIVTTTDSSSVTYGTIASTTVLFAILLAQYGIWKESSLCLLPLIVIQVNNFDIHRKCYFS